MARRAAARQRALRAARRHLHRRGHLRRRDRAARPPRRPRRQRRRAAALQRLRRRARLGLRRRRLVRRARPVRRPRRAQALRRRLPRHAASASSWTSSTTTSDRPATTCRSSGRTSPRPTRRPWGPAVNLDQPGSDAGAPLRPRQRADVAARLPRRRAAARRRARLRRRAGHAPARGDVGRGRGARRAAAQAAVPHRRERPQRRAGWSPRARPAGNGLDGQWADDVHHALHANLTGETRRLLRRLPRPAGAGQGAERGVPARRDVLDVPRARRTAGRCRRPMPGHPFVVYLQDHDQVGNRATGDRISATAVRRPAQGRRRARARPRRTRRCSGWARSGARARPWQFFSDHEGELGEAVRQGRRAEFGSHGWNTEDVPDPQSRADRSATARSTGPSSSRRGTPSCWPGRARSSRCAGRGSSCPTAAATASR